MITEVVAGRSIPRGPVLRSRRAGADPLTSSNIKRHNTSARHLLERTGHE